LIPIRDLPAVNATLNALATVLLLWGFTMIRQRKIEMHRLVMLSAFVVSIAFLTCYLIYHAHVGSVKYPNPGPIRYVYYSILITHVLLAFTVPVLAIITLSRALSRKFDKHRKIARWTFPIWLYVSVTGVVVYLMLYQFATPVIPAAFTH
jgi:putative membrane protein